MARSESWLNCEEEKESGVKAGCHIVPRQKMLKTTAKSDTGESDPSYAAGQNSQSNSFLGTIL